MIVLLDENFPLGLLRSLHNDGLSAEHIITLGWRGASDARIRERLQDDQGETGGLLIDVLRR